ncbi:MAG: DUF364 domain-containing protein, partial [Syntrophales bacterium]|nr:DUF364 domain-containing protein [Syntrophales bacterium]
MKPVWPQGEMACRLVQYVKVTAEGAVVKKTAVGSAYGAVMLDDGRVGLAAVLARGGCGWGEVGSERALGEAWEGSRVAALLVSLCTVGPTVAKTLALAAANALLNTGVGEEVKGHVEIDDLTPHDRVAMVGLFSPLVPLIKATGAALEVIELDPLRWPVMDRDKRDAVLQGCTVALITATTLINDTLEKILNALTRTRKVVLLGPSTPMAPWVFRGTPVTHLGGAMVVGGEETLRLVAAGASAKEL